MVNKVFITALVSFLCMVSAMPNAFAMSRQNYQPCSTAQCGEIPAIWQEQARRASETRITQTHSRDFSAVETLRLANRIYQEVMQSTVFTDDMDAYGKRDIYPTRAELEAGKKDGKYRGDCTTFSHLFYYRLIDSGIDPARLKRVRMDLKRRPGKVTNHMAVLLDDKYLLDSAEPSRRVIRFERSYGTPKMWLTESAAGWYQAARGQSPIVDINFTGFSLALQH